ncbi:sigma 54-interacting transcriptional regulator [Myxococcus sp. MISCRS1]|uniref:sigma 54-interacting transcriptional regulator n=1 Tax=Myxococcus sp. MISCRS1 TaxID=2996786 RepID=UPI00226F578B|nr:sigma 54-interacting transcriptional regulator [Myxococcus sp. MISCRS1]MCY0997893.1 sigma 54-interacting transcriptional regulator [Myxococcus sp. MISCRS1]
MSSGTTRPERPMGLPIRTLTIEVVGGPDQGHTHTAEGETVTVGTAESNELRLTDPTVSRYHLELSRKGDRVAVADLGSTNGTAVGPALLERGTVAPGSVLTLGRTSLRVGDGPTRTLSLHESGALGPLRGQSASMRRLMAQILRAARTDASVLLQGESGTGKELIARALHDESARAKKPFVTLDCGVISPGLVASELFGHERGAFTGADQRHIGVFERSHGGTLFLDEIGELSASLQTALLGVLERRRFRRLGGREELSVDVRVISATHRDLRAEVNANSFRLDLYYRLAVVRLEVPPLHQRVDDIPLLVEHFLNEAGYTHPVSTLVPPPLMRTLLTHRWPGNVRELRNYVEAILAMGEPPALEQAAPGANAPPAAAPPAPHVAVPLEQGYREARQKVLEDFELQFLKALLERAGTNISLAARLARMDRSYLIDLLHRHHLR